jgi:hypothetical protein
MFRFTARRLAVASTQAVSARTIGISQAQGIAKGLTEGESVASVALPLLPLG